MNVRRRTSSWLMYLFLATGSIGCYESTSPLSPPGSVRVEPVLMGTWRCVPDPVKPGENATLRVFRFDDVQYYFEWVEGNEVSRLRAYGSRIGQTVLLNVQELKAKDPSGKWIFVPYRLESPDKLRVAIVKEQAVKGLPEREALGAIRRRVTDDSLYEAWQICSREAS